MAGLVGVVSGATIGATGVGDTGAGAVMGATGGSVMESMTEDFDWVMRWRVNHMLPTMMNAPVHIVNLNKKVAPPEEPKTLWEDPPPRAETAPPLEG